MSKEVAFKNRDRFIQLGVAIVNGFSLEVFFNIADALDIDPADLINVIR